MAKQSSFDVVSQYDLQEMNNVIDQAKREILNRYDFKGTAAAVDFSDDEKNSITIEGENQYQLDAIMEMVRKKAATRNISQKVFKSDEEPSQSGMKMTKLVPLVSGLDQDKAKKITKLLREKLPKVKTQIQGEEVRVMSPKKDELQLAMGILQKAEFDFPLSFTNRR